MITRRQATRSFLQFLAASPLLKADKKYSELTDPMMRLANVFDFAAVAKKKVDPLAWDYLDEGSEDEVALRDSRKHFDDIIIRPHFLAHDVSKIDTAIQLFGKQLDSPIYLSVTGGKNCLFPNGEEECALGAAASNSMMITGGGIEQLISSGKGPKVWWQYTTATFRNKDQMSTFAKGLADSGCTAISVTVDIYHVSHRERSIHNGLSRSWCQGGGIPRDPNGALRYSPDDILWTTGDMPAARNLPTPTWDTLQRLREASTLPIVVKGILTSEDTEAAVKYGMSGVVVSNHGARQLDHTGATIEALPECIAAAAGKIPVLVDGGFRRGTDVFKALAMGATAVGVGRPYLWGMAAYGRKGVARVMDILRSELALDMGMAGVPSIAKLDKTYIRHRPYSR